MDDSQLVEILLVEDNPNDAELTLRALRKHHLANAVHWVKDGAEALEFLFCEGAYAGRGQSTPKLVLLDVHMPRVDGLEVLRRLRADERTRTIPVVIMTSSNQDRDVIESYQLGVNSYIVKPVRFEAFVDTAAKVGMYWLLLNQAPR